MMMIRNENHSAVVKGEVLTEFRSAEGDRGFGPLGLAAALDPGAKANWCPLQR